MKTTLTKILIVAILLLALLFIETDIILENFSLDRLNKNSIRFWIIIAIVTLYGVFASHISIQKNLETNEAK
jgi:Ca2+/Na+ antiporter